MNLDLLYKIMFLITMLITVWAAGVIWRRRSSPGAMALFFMMLAIFEWNLGALLEISSGDFASHIFWSKAAYFGAWTAQPLFLIFVLDYTRQKKRLTRLNIALLFVMPVLTILLALTNEIHHLVWAGFETSPDGHITYLHGVWFWISVVYVNIIMLAGTGILFRFVQRSRELYRHQNIWLVIAALFPWIGFSLYISPFNPFPGLDITPISFAMTGGVLVFLIARLSFLDVIPIAREFLIDNMLDGLLVLDHQNRVIDLNSAALQILNLRPETKWIGKPVEYLLPNQSGLGAYLESEGKLEIEWEQNVPEQRCYELQVLPLYQDSQRLTGRAIIFRDITNRKNIEQALWNANQDLEEKLAQIETLKDELRELSIRDALTGLFNRRYIEEIFTREVARARREGYPLSVIIMDLDDLKGINDQFGHACGDQILRGMGAAIQTYFRGGDIACRYGGDEFMLMLPGSTAQDSARRLDLFRADCKDRLSQQCAGLPTVTFSAGIAAYPQHAETSEELFRLADEALYRAKSDGRDRTCLP